MIYTSLHVLILDACKFITRASGRGLGPGFLGPKWHSPIGSMPISRGPKDSRYPGHNPPLTCPRKGCCPHQKLYARVHINPRCINIIFASLFPSFSLLQQFCFHSLDCFPRQKYAGGIYYFAFVSKFFMRGTPIFNQHILKMQGADHR
jgi:hypothetical protein